MLMLAEPARLCGAWPSPRTPRKNYEHRSSSSQQHLGSDELSGAHLEIQHDFGVAHVSRPSPAVKKIREDEEVHKLEDHLHLAIHWAGASRDVGETDPEQE